MITCVSSGQFTVALRRQMPARSEGREAEIGVACFEDGGSNVKPRNAGSYQKQGTRFPSDLPGGTPVTTLTLAVRLIFYFLTFKTIRE